MRRLFLVPRAAKGIGNKINPSEIKVLMSRTRDTTAEAASKIAREQAHKAMMEQLDIDLKATLQQSQAPKDILERREHTREMVENALKKEFGSVTVQSIGLDRLGLSLRQAPLELVVVDPNNDGLSLPRPENRLYHPLALIQALRNAGVSTELYIPPKWISSESIERPFALPYAAIINPALQLVLLPPNPEHVSRMAVLESYIRRYSTMQGVIGLLYILTTPESEVFSPPLTSLIISNLIMAYYSHKYMKAIQALADGTPSNGSLVFYSHPATVILPDGSLNASSCTEHVVATPDPSPELIPKRKGTTVTYDLLEMLRWWDQLRWDQDIIEPTSPIPLSRSLDAKSNTKKPWDWKHSPFLLQDPVNSLNNLATLISKPQYSELRRSLRSLQRNLRCGLRLSIARNLMRPLGVGAEIVSNTPGQFQSISSVSSSDYGSRLTEEMMQYYQKNRPTKEVERARYKTMSRLKKVIRKWYGPPEIYEPLVFGSSRYGVSDNGSDLDVVIMDKTRPHGLALEPKGAVPPIYQLHRLAGSLKAAGFTRIVTISGARVPIIKAADPETGLSVDININSMLGLHNTEMLEHYCQLWPALSTLIYVVKKWAKCRGLNDPSNGTGSGPSFSSYCLTLMIVGFLQSQGVLPNLQGMWSGAGRERDSSSEFHDPNERRLWVWIEDTKTSRVKCEVDWYRVPSESWTPFVNPSLGQAFYAWLTYYGFDHKYDEFAVRIAEGGIVPRRTKEKPKRHDKDGKVNDGETTVEDATEEDATNDLAVEGTKEADAAAITVEVLTDDVDKKELESIAADTIGKKRHEPEMEEMLKDHQVVRESQLDEPERWRVAAFVVGDPFIYEKNCAGNVSKSTVNEFVTFCRETLDQVDSGATLETLLSHRIVKKEIKKRKREKREKKKAEKQNKPLAKGVADTQTSRTTQAAPMTPKGEHNPTPGKAQILHTESQEGGS